MKLPLGKRTWLLGLALVALSGCATYPVAKNLRQQARPVTLLQALASPGTYQGTMVIWGGKIIQTLNHTNGADLYILQLPLTRQERPVLGAASAGRFIAHSGGFLDPEVYRPGRLVTVAGPLAGLKTAPVQKTRYTYPVVDLRQVHVWPVNPRRYYYYYYSPGYYPAWYWNGWGPGWYWGGYWPGGVGWNWDWDGGDWDEGYHFHGDRDGGDFRGGWDREEQGGDRGAWHGRGRR